MGFEYNFTNQINPFLICSIVFVILLFVQCKRTQNINNGKINILLILCITSIISCIILEEFYYEKCPIDPTRYYETLEIFSIELQALKQMKIEHIVYYGTLLYILRGTKFSVWDHDSDILIIKPQNVDAFLHKLSKTIENISSECHVVYFKNRDLIQIKKDNAHGDIWLFQLKNLSNNQNEKILVNHDYTVSHPIIEYNLLFPSNHINWFGLKVPIPNNYQLAAKMEFGDDYMTPRYHRFQCLENIITGKISFARIILYIFIILISNFIAISILKLINDPQSLQTIRRSTTSLIIATIPTKLIDFSLQRFSDNYHQNDDDINQERISLISPTEST